MDLFNRAYIPARFSEASFENFIPQTAMMKTQIDVLKRYIQAFEPGKLGRAFFGTPGTGKTHLLSAIIRYLTLEKGISCRYVEFTQLLFDIRSLYAENKPESSLINPLVELPVLFLDELGKGKCTDFEIRIIDEIITRRYNDPSLSTFFASNYFPKNLVVKKNASEQEQVRYQSMDFLEDRIQFRSASRIFEMCEFMTLHGEDYRQKLQSQIHSK